MKTPAIYPLYIDNFSAQSLVKKHFLTEFNKELRYKSPNVQLSFSASILENGDVDLLVHYSDDDGFMMSSGPLIRETFRPFSPEEIEKYVAKRKFALAAEVRRARLEAKEMREILKIQAQMFPASP